MFAAADLHNFIKTGVLIYMGYERLEKSLIDLVKEEQAKLGYRKEMIRLYYPLSSLNHFMETNADSEEMQELLADFPKAAEDIFGEVGITHAKDRFCFALSEKASEYVHENMKPNEFIKELVELVAKHGCTMEDIEVLFRSHSDKIVAEPMDNGEFDRMIRFEEGEDKYYYCFKDEGCHIIYHRFLPEDYADFGFKPDKKIRNRGNTNENRNI
ncbi:hypothetical protein COPCOM_02496 [Coprococcus comes ATCC 27758]|uniref:Uncharacterized protein n=2 Tax=Coprococcus comes TaxID=410072 RepID=C0BBN8_9FIRM|nr:hypothetical protein COPCOM_02496 [Coprococcus comes ATCC 27758]